LNISYHAEDQFSFAQDAEPNDVKGLLDKAKSFSNSFERDKAIIYYDKVLAIEPNNTAALIGKGDALSWLGAIRIMQQVY